MVLAPMSSLLMSQVDRRHGVSHYRLKGSILSYEGGKDHGNGFGKWQCKGRVNTRHILKGRLLP